MIIWGSRSKTLKLGSAGFEQCATCGQTRQFNYYLDYRYGHLYYIIRAVTQQQYYKLCEICRHGSTLDKKQMELQLGKNPISPFDRYGFAVLIGMFLLMCGGVIVSNM
jgi:hypothetical protein